MHPSDPVHLPGPDFFVAASTVIGALIIALFVGSNFLSTRELRQLTSEQPGDEPAGSSQISGGRLLLAIFYNLGLTFQLFALAFSAIGLYSALNALADPHPTHRQVVWTYTALDFLGAALAVAVVRRIYSPLSESTAWKAFVSASEIIVFIGVGVLLRVTLVPTAFQS